MASGSSASIENLCKICLNESHLDGNLSELEIDGTSVMSIIERIIYSIDWTNSVIFPDKICSDCLEIVQTIHKLNERAVESDTRLKRLLATDENGQIIVEEIVTVIETNDDGQDRKQQSDIVDAQQLATSTSIEHDEEADEGKNKCQHCDEIFDEPSRLLQHLKIHDSKRMACEAAEGCTTRFAKQATLMRHEIIHNSGALVKTNEEKHECVVCSEQFMDQRALAAHTTESHKDEIEFQCSFCTEKFSKLSELAKHAKSHSENKSYKCLICAKTFSQGSHLIDHLNRHNNLRPHVCKICNKAFQQSSTLKDHIRTHTSEKPFLCNECGKSFNNPSNLRQHVRRHLNLKEFHCQLCPGRFSSKAALEGHVRSHNGVKPHQCSICGSSFTKGSSLKKHVRSIHEKIKPYECSSCSMKFHSSEHLKRHTRIHTGDRPYVCNINGCKKSYAQSNDLLKHKKVHLGDEVYKCTLCDEAFRLQVQLREHYRVHYVSSGGDDSKTLTVQ